MTDDSVLEELFKVGMLLFVACINVGVGSRSKLEVFGVGKTMVLSLSKNLNSSVGLLSQNLAKKNQSKAKRMMLIQVILFT